MHGVVEGDRLAAAVRACLVLLQPFGLCLRGLPLLLLSPFLALRIERGLVGSWGEEAIATEDIHDLDDSGLIMSMHWHSPLLHRVL